MFASVIGFSLISATLYGGWHALVKLRSHSPAAICIGQLFGGAICLLAIFYIEPFFLTGRILAIIFLSGFFHAVYLYLLGFAYKSGELSIIVPLSRSISIVIIYALVATIEDLLIIKCIGILFIISGAFFINFDKNLKLSNGNVLISVLIGLLTVLYSFVDKYGMDFMSPFAFSSAISLATGIFLVIFLFFRKIFFSYEKKSLNRNDIFFGLLIGITGLSIYSSFLILLNYMPLSFAMANRQFSIIISAVFGFFIFKEKFSKIKILSLLTLILGILFLNYN